MGSNDLTLKMVLDLSVGQAMAALKNYTSGLADTKTAAQEAAAGQSKSYEQIRSDALAAFGRTKEAAEQAKVSLDAAQQTAQQLAKEWKAGQAAAGEYKAALDKASQGVSSLKGVVTENQEAQAAARQELQATSVTLKESQSRLSAIEKEYKNAGSNAEQYGIRLKLATQEVADLSQAEATAKEKFAAASAALAQNNQALIAASAAQKEAAAQSRSSATEAARQEAAFTAARQGVSAAEAAYIGANNSLNQLRGGLQQAATATQQHENATRNNSNAQNENGSATLGLIGRLKQFVADIEAAKQATLAASGATGQHSAAVAKNAAEHQRSGSSITSLLGNITALSGSWAAATAAISGVTAVIGMSIGKLIEINSAYDKINRTLATVTGSQQKAGRKWSLCAACPTGWVCLWSIRRAATPSWRHRRWVPSSKERRLAKSSSRSAPPPHAWAYRRKSRTVPCWPSAR
jgi:chromosome segregation ATPase